MVCGGVVELSRGTNTPALFNETKLDYLKYILLFVLIQLVSLVLAIIGIPVCGLLTAAGLMHLGADNKAHFPAWAWLWDNNEDGVSPVFYNPSGSRWKAFVWIALRNPVSNLRFVPGVSGVGRPLYYRTWLVKGRQFYFKAGWLSDGYPALSAGAGKGF
jgi:hypothetical protein